MCINRYLRPLIYWPLLFILPSQAEAAVWPFNTPTARVAVICKNMVRQAEFWANARKGAGGLTYGEALETLRSDEIYSIQADPSAASYNRIFYREMRRAAEVVWRNPNVDGVSAAKIVDRFCEESRPRILLELKQID